MPATDWVEQLAPFDAWNERVIMAVLAVLGKPASYLDLGSGTGAMANLARRMGIDAVGVDQVARPDAHLLQRDLRQPLELGRQFDLVTCLEVAEHLPPEHDETLCRSIGRHLQRGGWLVFSSAHPGQSGEGHIGTRPAYHWRTKLYDVGISYQAGPTSRVALALLNLQSPLVWLAENVMVFDK